jgi:hypothetical protein
MSGERGPCDAPVGIDVVNRGGVDKRFGKMIGVRYNETYPSQYVIFIVM